MAPPLAVGRSCLAGVGHHPAQRAAMPRAWLISSPRLTAVAVEGATGRRQSCLSGRVANTKPAKSAFLIIRIHSRRDPDQLRAGERLSLQAPGSGPPGTAATRRPRLEAPSPVR